MLRFLSIVVVLFSLAFSTTAQTYRGAINGSVTDPSGAVIPSAEVKAKDKATDITRTTTTTSDGDFVFQDLPVGIYSVIVTASGFPEMTVDNVSVTQGSIYTLPIKLSMSQQATTVEVSAASLSLDTTTETQTTTVTGEALQDMPLNGRDFTQLISVTPGFAGYSAGGYGSLNGTRANQVNWQIDGGITTISGTTFPPSIRAAFPASPASSCPSTRSINSRYKRNLPPKQDATPAALLT